MSTGPDLRIPLSDPNFARKASTCSAANRTLADAEREHILDVLRETHGVLGGTDVPRSLRRYDKPDDGATDWIVLQADASVMGFNKRLANGKSQAEATG